MFWGIRYSRDCRFCLAPKAGEQVPKRRYRNELLRLKDTLGPLVALSDYRNLRETQFLRFCSTDTWGPRSMSARGRTMLRLLFSSFIDRCPGSPENVP